MIMEMRVTFDTEVLFNCHINGVICLPIKMMSIILGTTKRFINIPPLKALYVVLVRRNLGMHQLCGTQFMMYTKKLWRACGPRISIFLLRQYGMQIVISKGTPRSQKSGDLHHSNISTCWYFIHLWSGVNKNV